MHAKRTRDRKKKLLESSETQISRMERESHLLRGYCVSLNMLSAEEASKSEERTCESKRELAALKVINHFTPHFILKHLHEVPLFLQITFDFPDSLLPAPHSDISIALRLLKANTTLTATRMTTMTSIKMTNMAMVTTNTTMTGLCLAVMTTRSAVHGMARTMRMSSWTP